jgi:biotin carboxylase
VCPEYSRPDFLDWLREYVARHGIEAIVPSEGLLLALRPALDEFVPLLPFFGPPAALYAGMSKCDVFTRLAGSTAGGNLPPSLLVEAADPAPDGAALAALGLPLYLKADACYSRDGSSGTVRKAATAESAVNLLGELRARYDKVLVQGHVPGAGVGAFFLRRGGQVLAEFMHRRLHEVPYDGGVSSLRESTRLPDLRDDALAKLGRLDWDGVAMMEYRWDPARGRFAFLELNGRFWGSLHLALYAGVDFPRLLLDSFHGHPTESVTEYRTGVRCRHTFPGEVQYVWSRLRARELSRAARAWSVLEFVLMSLDPRVHGDLLFPGDRKLFWQNFRRFLGGAAGAAWRRLKPWRAS